MELRLASPILARLRRVRFRSPSHAPTVGAPGFEPGTSATRTQRSTGLSHAPKREERLPSNHSVQRTGWDGPPGGFTVLGRLQHPACNGRGGIRTHAGVNPHDFQSCALSHSATRPIPSELGGGPKPLPSPRSAEGVGLSCGWLRQSSLVSVRLGLSGPAYFGSNSNPIPSASLRSAEGVGFEPTWCNAPTP